MHSTHFFSPSNRIQHFQSPTFLKILRQFSHQFKLTILIAQRGAKPMIAQRGAKPMIAQQGAKPMIAQQGAKPMIAQRGEKPMIAQRGAKPKIIHTIENQI